MREAARDRVELDLVLWSWIWRCGAGFGVVELDLVLCSWIWCCGAGFGVVELDGVMWSWIWCCGAGFGRCAVGWGWVGVELGPERGPIRRHLI